jgi:radical SAM superfamily enzyme YgiQ (UPF0313 family)
MELPRRAQGDILLAAGEMTDIRGRLRHVAAEHDLATVVVCAFDHRTRILPFVFADTRMVPAGVRAIGAALVDSGFAKTRIVLQQWNRNFSPAQMRLDGRIPDMLLVSSMHLHAAQCDWLIRDAHRIDPAQRPLIIAGGPRMIYEPWEVFSSDPRQPWGADVAVTGEEYVLLQLLEVLLAIRGQGESMRSAFLRARDMGALDEIPGLVYGRSAEPDGPTEELIDTGIQRLVGNLDELPSSALGYQLLEAPSNSATLDLQSLPAHRVRKHCRIASIVLTIGCKFRCSYCPIPAYNQRQHRVKSGERVVEEMGQIAGTYGIPNFFGADDNFFNDTKKTMDIVEPLARKIRERKRPYCKIRWGTEATVHDTVRMQEHLPVIREAGLVAIWMGVEDITGSLVKKGQNEDKTFASFQLLRQNGIHPVPMMMHHDSQPLITWKGNYGLLNQLRLLRRAGSLYTQVLMLTPAPGSKWYENTYTSGLAFRQVGDEKIEHHRVDGNYVVASESPRPWVKQLNLLVGYTYFFNPLRFLLALGYSKSRIPRMDAEMLPEEELTSFSPWKRVRRRWYLKTRAHLVDAGVQALGMVGLVRTYRQTLVWAWHLFRGKIQRADRAPCSPIPMRDPLGRPASHALPGTQLPIARGEFIPQTFSIQPPAPTAEWREEAA